MGQLDKILGKNQGACRSKLLVGSSSKQMKSELKDRKVVDVAHFTTVFHTVPEAFEHFLSPSQMTIFTLENNGKAPLSQ